MAAEQFGRLVQVDIGKIGATTAVRVEGLRVTFEVKKDLTSTSNRARITIYNLAAATFAKFQELKDHVWLRVGYENSGAGLQQIFEGDLVSVSPDKEGGDLAIRLEANDGQFSLGQSYASVSYAENTQVSQVLKDLVASMGLGPSLPADLSALFTDQQYVQGFAFAGKNRAALDKVTARAGLTWSIQDNRVKLLKKGQHDGTPDDQVPLVTPDSGLIGSPMRLSQVNEQEAARRPPGWKVVCLIRPQVVPGGRLGLRSREVPRPTAFTVETVMHEGDTHGPLWNTTAEVLEPGELLKI